jgi:hypothetical protein
LGRALEAREPGGEPVRKAVLPVLEFAVRLRAALGLGGRRDRALALQLDGELALLGRLRRLVALDGRGRAGAGRG